MAKKPAIKKAKPGPPAQKYLDISEIKENVVVLKDGTLRSVIMVSSVNFALKSRDEQQAMIQAYMQFLNGLDHTLQVVIQSRKMNIDAYIQALNAQEKEISNELLKTQIRDYRSFIQDLVELGEIMQKRFYVVVPYDPSTDKRRGFISKLMEAVTPASSVKLNKKQFDERRDALMQRVSIVQGGLSGMGLQTAILDTQSLIELYYTVYNPEVFDTQRLADLGAVRVEEGF